MLRRIIAALGPSIALIALSLVLQPDNLGYLAFLLMAAALMLAATGALLIRPKPERPTSPDTGGWLAVLFVMAVAATGIYWFRVWQYDAWDIATIPIRLLYVVTFWWPGLLVATLAWMAAGREVYRTLNRYTVVLGVGLVAGIAGTAAYQVTHTVYFKAHDGQNLEQAMNRLAAGIPGQTVWQNHRGLLTVIVDCAWATEAPPYTVYSCLNHVSQGTLRLLPRADVSEVNVQATANGLLLFMGSATDAAPGDARTWLKRIDRSRLKDGGALDKASIDEMAQLEPGECPTAEEQQAFESEFHYSVSGSEVAIDFEPGAPLSVNNVNRLAVAYRLANRIITETATYFPEIESFQVDLAGLERTVSREEAQTEPFYLQAQMMPQDRVLGLTIRARGLGTVSLEPATFNASGLPEENQVAVAATNGNTTEYKLGRLFEAIPVNNTRLIITEVQAEGAITLFVLPQDGVPAGPLAVQPEAEEIAANQWIRNLGLIERAAFPALASASPPR